MYPIFLLRQAQVAQAEVWETETVVWVVLATLAVLLLLPPVLFVFVAPCASFELGASRIVSVLRRRAPLHCKKGAKEF